MNSVLKENVSCAKKYIFAFFKWLTLGVLIGTIGGVLGAAFAKSIEYVTELRGENGWIIYFLPVGGLIITVIYKLCKVTGIGTNQVFESIRSEKNISPLLAPAVFFGTVITHLCGGSAGREGAALQLGGSVSAALSRLLKLDKHSSHILTMCGMGAFFAALFGTPLGAFVFAIEVVSVGHFCSAAFFPGIVSAVTAYMISNYLGVAPERFSVSFVPDLSLMMVFKVMSIGVVGAVVSILFCKSIHFGEKLFKKYLPNVFIRAAVGGVILIILTLVFGKDYNGGGIDIIHKVFINGEVKYEAFLLKILFTVITISAGFKGGEIVPTLFIGATLGGAISTVLGVDMAFGAAVSMTALFSGVTNCPIATIFLSTEMFGGEGILFYAVSSVISFLLSGSSSLYEGQKLIYSKLNEDVDE